MSNATYNELGKLFDLSLGNGLTTSYRYWGLNYGGNAHYGMLYSIATGSRQNLTYSDYDGVGNIKQMIDGRNSNETISFGYDHLDRLTSASSTLGWSEANQHNSIGNFVNQAGATYQKYSPPEAEVLVKAEKTNGEVTISVIDRGIGIAPEDLPHMFERYY